MESAEFNGADHLFFSIVIASFNAKNDLAQCLDSIGSQTFTNYEVLVSDGGSVDGTAEYLSTGGVRNLTWYKSSPDYGIYDALNIALDNVSGKWILVLGADDKLCDPEALARAFQHISHKDLAQGIVYANLYISNKGKVRLKEYPEFGKFVKQYSGGGFIHHKSAFVAKASLDSVGRFSMNYSVHSDYDLMLRIIKISGAVKIDDVFVEFNSDGYSSRWINLWRSLNEIYNIRKIHGFRPLPVRLIALFVVSIVRRAMLLVPINSFIIFRRDRAGRN